MFRIYIYQQGLLRIESLLFGVCRYNIPVPNNFYLSKHKTGNFSFCREEIFELESLCPRRSSEMLGKGFGSYLFLFSTNQT